MLSLKFSFKLVLENQYRVYQYRVRSTARFKFQKSQTATGPDMIPYWVWRDHAKISTPLITKIWKPSLLPRAGHRLGNERISPLYPKWNYQNIKETIAALALLLLQPRCLRKQSIAAMLRRLQNNVFLPRSFLTGRAAIVPVLFRHRINSYLDNPDCREVPVFTMDFSKAFDSVKNDLRAFKPKKLPLNPKIVN